MAGFGSTLASLVFVFTMFQGHFPRRLQFLFEKYLNNLIRFFYPYVEIVFHECNHNRFKRSEAYTSIDNYLSSKSCNQATKLRADVVDNSKDFILSMEDYQEVSDVFNGVKLYWSKERHVINSKVISFYPSSNEKRFYKLSFHRRHRDLITSAYLKHVLEEGKAIKARNRQRKLYTNVPLSNSRDYGDTGWNHVVFEHPATFDTLAMDPNKKKEIMDDLITFSKAKEYYARIGKAWKRGYLLYGPPGTGKSTMVAAIANFLKYDVYDLELTSVKNNTELRTLLIETSSKSIIVIEDIDCSLDLTGQRRKTVENLKEEEEDEEICSEELTQKMEKMKDGEVSRSKVTLSGLLNVIDGIWSATGGERLIIFTTNYLEKLDKALVRTGRMDKHIELSYCDFEGFKVLAKNYLGVDSHDLFGLIEGLLKETKMSPADVAENLMPKTMKEDVKSSLENLIQALSTAEDHHLQAG